jgi:hypothetical protein
MSLKIVDANIADLASAKRGRRSRSPETERLVEAVSGLTPRTAKAVIPEGSETLPRLRARLNYAARAAGKKVRIVTGENRLMFALRAGRTPSASREGAAERKAAVQARAIELGRRRKTDISAQDVIDALESAGVNLDVARPGTMIGAVLRSMPEFTRTGHNKFRYSG